MPKVSLLSMHEPPWWRQFPNGTPVWDGWEFFFNEHACEEYDYLVIYDELGRPITPRCPMENTIHIASEPPTVRRYGRHYPAQFGLALTLDQEIDLPNGVNIQPGLPWYLGWQPRSRRAGATMNFAELESLFDEPRTKLISVISSDKAFTDDHRRRLAFAHALKANLGDGIDFFGRGIKTMEDKLEALRGYRFHIALENSSVPHYFTEKISDSFIAGAYPLYWGCPNLEDYVPTESFQWIDITDLDAAVEAVRRAIDQEIDKRRRDAVREARHRMIYEHNIFPMLVRLLTARRETPGPKAPRPIKRILPREWFDAVL